MVLYPQRHSLHESLQVIAYGFLSLVLLCHVMKLNHLINENSRKVVKFDIFLCSFLQYYIRIMKSIKIHICILKRKYCFQNLTHGKGKCGNWTY